MERALRRKLPHGRFVGVTKGRSQQMRAVRGRGNKTTETRFRSALVRAGIRGWSIAPQNIPGRPDFYFAKARLAVFVDGCFWHGCPQCGHVPRTNSKFWRAKIERNRQRDRATTAALRAEGLRVVRLWEHKLRENLAGCVGRVHSLLNKAHGRADSP
ncbi:MAG: very short patch repair endonuclease [Verrucomicrobia bacterium]|nr:very short patch repair endonuclease [Verrucomicrobiota bacterium]